MDHGRRYGSSVVCELTGQDRPSGLMRYPLTTVILLIFGPSGIRNLTGRVADQ